jgi:transcriptional regulator with XRE-family HTH domain
MAGIPREQGPTAERVAANLRSIRQERGLSYAALSRRLADLGHPVLDTGLMKIEKGQRRVGVDDLVALAVALDCTPNRLLLPEVEFTRPGALFALTPGRDKVRTDDAWAWAYGERPLGHKAASLADEEPSPDELAFLNENRRHYTRGAFGWLAATDDWAQATARGDEKAAAEATRPGAKTEGSGVIAGAILGAFTRYGLDTREIRQAAESGIIATLIQEEPATAEQAFRQVWAWLTAHGTEEP